MTRNQWLILVILVVAILLIVLGLAFDFNLSSDGGRD